MKIAEDIGGGCGGAEDTVPLPDPNARKDLLEAFSGEIKPTELSFRYRMGLIVVAVMMILLPAVYVGLAGATAYLVYYHATQHLGILTSGGSGLGSVVVYFGPLFAGATLVCFMVKPFFARRTAMAERYSVTPKDQPLLFAFIGEICQLVKAPLPSQVDVNCEVNASASFRRGMASIAGNDVVLTIGLPLIAGMTAQEFAGVLAHELGHFAQGAGMRLTYVIRTINAWFARVVNERDQWDVNLEKAAKGVDLRIGIVFHLARLCIWLTRRVLWVLMHAGHAISCFMLRQMEYDADSYETKVAGSAVFSQTTLRIQTLNIARQAAYAEIRESWNSKRLPDDVSALIVLKSTQIPPDVMEQTRLAFTGHKTGLFDTHPADLDRVRAAQHLNEAGVFHSDAPATELFAAFPELSRKVTRFHYEKEHGLGIDESNLVSTDQTRRESNEQAEARRAMGEYFGGLNVYLRPLFIRENQTIPLPVPQASIDNLTRLRARLIENRPAIESLVGSYSESARQEVNFSAALCLLEVGCSAKASAFGLPEWSLRTATDAQAAAALNKIHFDKELAPWEKDACNRLSAALQLLKEPSVMEKMKESGQVQIEIGALVRALDALNGIWPTIMGIVELGGQLDLLFTAAQSADQQKIFPRVNRLAPQLLLLINKNLAQLQNVPYPFDHATGRISIADYARSDVNFRNDVERAYREAQIHADRIHSLYFRIMGRLVLIARQVEDAMFPSMAP